MAQQPQLTSGLGGSMFATDAIDGFKLEESAAEKE